MARPAASLPQTQTINVEVAQPARDRVTLSIEVRDDGDIASGSISAIGCTDLLVLVEEWRKYMRGPLAALSLPLGDGHASMLLREAILRAKGEWDFPYKDEELCHCRAIPTAKVDAAVISGCHTVDAVKRATSASTSCGTCRPDVERVIAYRTRK